MSISLPGLAHFGCDLSATVGGIPNFGQKSSSRKLPSKRCKEGAGQALSADYRPPLMGGWSAYYCTRMSGIHQSNRQLRPEPWPRSLPAAIANRALAGAWNQASCPRGMKYPRMGMTIAISNALLCGALATAGRGRRQVDSRNRPITASSYTHRQITSWALWGADAAVNALPALRRSRR